MQNGIRRTIWNTNKVNGWSNYLEETGNNKALQGIESSDETNTDNLMKRFEKELTNVKFRCFGKVSMSKKKKGSDKVRKLQEKKHQLDKMFNGSELEIKRKELEDTLNKAVDDVQHQAMQTEVTKLKTMKATKGISAAVFKLREGVLGSSKSSSDPIIINDPVSGSPVMSPDQIKSITLNYCVKLLTNREPKSGYFEVIRKKEQLHEIRMKEVIVNDCDLLTPEMFNSALRHLKIKHFDKYKFILKGGSSL